MKTLLIIFGVLIASAALYMQLNDIRYPKLTVTVGAATHRYPPHKQYAMMCITGLSTTYTEA